jgi:carbon storage regulator
MLVVTRRKDEKIIINNEIEIVVLGVQGDKVRIGVNAPKEVPVDRAEIAAKKAASRGLPVTE